MINNLRDLARAAVLEEGSIGSSFWVKSGSGRILSFEKMKPYLVSLDVGLKPGDLELLKIRLDFFRHEDFVKYDKLIIRECSAESVNPALFKAMGLLESSLGRMMKGDGSQKGFIHMTRDTYDSYFSDDVSYNEREETMLSPERSMPICVRHVKYLIDKFKVPEEIIFAVKNGENKVSKSIKGLEKEEADKLKTSMIDNSKYTQAALALRQAFAKSGPLPVGGKF
jgi:hypothetical protein